MQRITPVVLNLLIINALVYFAQTLFGGDFVPNMVTDTFALHHYKSEYFKPHQLITHMFMHGSFFHLFFNMFALWMFGSAVENAWGTKKLLIFYFTCGLGAALTQMASYTYDYWPTDHAVINEDMYRQYQEILRATYTVGASGAIMGILVAFGFLFPNTELIIMPIPIPIKAKWAVTGMVAMDVFGGVVKVQGDNIAHFAHLGGALIGFLLLLFWKKSSRKTFY